MNCPHCNHELTEAEILSLNASLMAKRSHAKPPSEARIRAARENGRKGGRKRKEVEK